MSMVRDGLKAKDAAGARYPLMGVKGLTACCGSRPDFELRQVRYERTT